MIGTQDWTWLDVDIHTYSYALNIFQGSESVFDFIVFHVFGIRGLCGRGSGLTDDVRISKPGPEIAHGSGCYM